jgi:uncharacterized DUF497 family protein
LTIWFEWDAEKAASNRRKHGVSFDTATQVFADPFALIEQDRIEGGEQRWRTLGMVGGTLVLLVAHTLIDLEDEDEVVRIISARPATAREQRGYEAERIRREAL